jgi:hypothetical protein
VDSKNERFGWKVSPTSKGISIVNFQLIKNNLKPIFGYRHARGKKSYAADHKHASNFGAALWGGVPAA